jgi:hypothetical protein
MKKRAIITTDYEEVTATPVKAKKTKAKTPTTPTTAVSAIAGLGATLLYTVATQPMPWDDAGDTALKSLLNKLLNNN